VEEISGVAFIFNQKFFQDLREATGKSSTLIEDISGVFPQRREGRRCLKKIR